MELVPIFTGSYSDKSAPMEDEVKFHTTKLKNGKVLNDSHSQLNVHPLEHKISERLAVCFHFSQIRYHKSFPI